MELTDERLDQIIMSVTLANWQKVAMILARSLHQIGDAHTSFEKLAARIKFLVRAGRLERQGDLSSWRHSEIRIPVRAQ
ncbi:DUF3658 domain-containing protein [Mesorhizobium sp. AaZ16]|uniref:DUF3658 domain-containing protein n=1 Tax=Mesorhizobium sp. AaZ16 TaxID=3402289 RepID=UPI00374E3154